MSNKFNIVLATLLLASMPVFAGKNVSNKLSAEDYRILIAKIKLDEKEYFEKNNITSSFERHGWHVENSIPKIDEASKKYSALKELQVEIMEAKSSELDDKRKNDSDLNAISAQQNATLRRLKYERQMMGY